MPPSLRHLVGPLLVAPAASQGPFPFFGKGRGAPPDRRGETDARTNAPCPHGPLFIVETGFPLQGFVCPAWRAILASPSLPLVLHLNGSSPEPYSIVDFFLAPSAPAALLLDSPAPPFGRRWAGRCAWNPALPPRVDRVVPPKLAQLTIHSAGIDSPQTRELSFACLEGSPDGLGDRPPHPPGLMFAVIFCLAVSCVCGMSRHFRQSRRRSREQVVLRRVNAALAAELPPPAPSFFAAQAKEKVERETMSQLAQLPVRNWQQLEATAAADHTDCALCMEPFRALDELRILPCKHYFHKACLDPWFRLNKYVVRTCPLCKAEPIQAAAPLELAASIEEAPLPDLRVVRL
ncbi:hypothetical protein AB1Y20_003429 [Prymnesium parvum]|uniref:RING-type domain-containing protein n=1 Tax=Prymnesium parvum TaxID=97485 RepID=A0AB34JBU2_PRYPA